MTEAKKEEEDDFGPPDLGKVLIVFVIASLFGWLLILGFNVSGAVIETILWLSEPPSLFLTNLVWITVGFMVSALVMALTFVIYHILDDITNNWTGFHLTLTSVALAYGILFVIALFGSAAIEFFTNYYDEMADVPKFWRTATQYLLTPFLTIPAFFYLSSRVFDLASWMMTFRIIRH